MSEKIICPRCHKEVLPVIVSTGSSWVDPRTGYAEDDYHDSARCPVCDYEIPEEKKPVSPNFDDVPY